ncbi:unnamed protein product, partial [Porites lobata]
KGINGAGWNFLSSQVYSVCDITIPTRPTNWLRTDFIAVKDAKMLNIKLKYNLRRCPPPPEATSFCKHKWSIYVLHVEKEVVGVDLDPVTAKEVTYQKVTTIAPTVMPAPGKVEQYDYDVKIITKKGGVYLAFLDQGACVSISSVTVSYNYCPEIGSVLVRFSRTSAPVNDSYPKEQTGRCTDVNSINKMKLSGVCLSSGEWNVTDGIKCLCKPGHELVIGSEGNVLECSACLKGFYKSVAINSKCDECPANSASNTGRTGCLCHEGFYKKPGLHVASCKALPKAPRSAIVAVVKETYVEIMWERSPDESDGKLRYSVHCFRCKSSKYKDCNESCGPSVEYKPNKDNITDETVAVNGLPSDSFLKFRVYSVSELNEQEKDRDKWNYVTVTVNTKVTCKKSSDFHGVIRFQSSFTIRWELEDKNFLKIDIICLDDSLKYRIMAIKTNENFTPFSNGVTFRKPRGTDLVTASELIPGFCRSKANLFLFCTRMHRIVCFRFCCFYSFCVVVVFLRNRTNKKEDHVMPEEGSSNTHPMEELNLLEVVEERNEDDVVNVPEYLEIINSPSFELKREKIAIERLLGSGNFCKVYKATLDNDTVAVKSLKARATSKDKEDVITELNIMKRLKPHPHVLKLIGCCSISDPLLIVLEYLPYGDLLGYLRKSRGHSDNYNTGEKKPASKLTAKDLLSFAWMIADGMHYLATMKIIHRDLAARNILVGENQVCKISDFGLARDVNDDIYVRTSQARLPVKWMPPESLFHGESSTMSDVWSYGIVLWEVFTIGDSPYPGFTARQTVSMLEREYRMQRPIHISEELFSIMSECWSEKPEERPTFKWICTAVNRLIKDTKTCIDLDECNDADYVNFDMAEGAQ